MSRINPLIRITLGLVSVTLILVLAGDYALELTRDQSGVDFRQREKVAETLALQFSPLAEINDTETIGKTMDALVERNRDILSAALRGSDGKIVTATDDHEEYWKSPGAGVTTLTHADVPLMVDASEWGTVEVSFAPKRDSFLPFLTTDPLIRFILFITASACFGYFFFMKRTLTHLDPTAVIPDKVKATLDLLAEGVGLDGYQGQYRSRQSHLRGQAWRRARRIGWQVSVGAQVAIAWFRRRHQGATLDRGHERGQGAD